MCVLMLPPSLCKYSADFGHGRVLPHERPRCACALAREAAYTRGHSTSAQENHYVGSTYWGDLSRFLLEGIPDNPSLWMNAFMQEVKKKLDAATFRHVRPCASLTGGCSGDSRSPQMKFGPFAPMGAPAPFAPLGAWSSQGARGGQAPRVMGHLGGQAAAVQPLINSPFSFGTNSQARARPLIGSCAELCGPGDVTANYRRIANTKAPHPQVC